MIFRHGNGRRCHRDDNDCQFQRQWVRAELTSRSISTFCVRVSHSLSFFFSFSVVLHARLALISLFSFLCSQGDEHFSSSVTVTKFRCYFPPPILVILLAAWSLFWSQGKSVFIRRRRRPRPCGNTASMFSVSLSLQGIWSPSLYMHCRTSGLER